MLTLPRLAGSRPVHRPLLYLPENLVWVCVLFVENTRWDPNARTSKVLIRVTSMALARGARARTSFKWGWLDKWSNVLASSLVGRKRSQYHHSPQPPLGRVKEGKNTSKYLSTPNRSLRRNVIRQATYCNPLRAVIYTSKLNKFKCCCNFVDALAERRSSSHVQYTTAVVRYQAHKPRTHNCLWMVMSWEMFVTTQNGLSHTHQMHLTNHVCGVSTTYMPRGDPVPI